VTGCGADLQSITGRYKRCTTHHLPLMKVYNLDSMIQEMLTSWITDLMKPSMEVVTPPQISIIREARRAPTLPYKIPDQLKRMSPYPKLHRLPIWKTHSGKVRASCSTQSGHSPSEPVHQGLPPLQPRPQLSYKTHENENLSACYFESKVICSVCRPNTGMNTFIEYEEPESFTSRFYSPQQNEKKKK